MQLVIVHILYIFTTTVDTASCKHGLGEHPTLFEHFPCTQS